MTEGIKTGTPGRASELRRLLTNPPTQECIIWWGTRGPSGYGYVNFDGRRWLAHRLLLTWREDRELDPREYALHSCDNPPCVNPLHISVGSQLDNMRQCSERGRVVMPGIVGEQHYKAKLTECDVREIRRQSETGSSRTSLADRFGVTRANINYIINRKTWTHVD